MTLRSVGDTDLLVCGNCGLGRVPDMASDADFWSTQGREPEVHKDYWTTARARMFQMALTRLESNGAGGRIVDIGGGIGYFAHLALERGWDAYSFDVSEQARVAAAERIGAPRALSENQLEPFAGTCDAVTLWCVIAHVPEPLDVVTNAVNLLKPGGRLLVTTPNFIFQGALARLLAKLDRPYDLVCRDHRLHFTPSALRALLCATGLHQFGFHYLGVAESCFLVERFGRALVPAKRLWNYAGAHTPLVGLPPLGSELQVIATRA